MVRFKNPKSVPPLEAVEIPPICGPMRGHEWPPEVMADMEAGWWAYRDQLMEEHDRLDWRPWGWWEFEAKEPRPDYGEEAARLGELST